jgi:hypothetical protein
MSILLFQLKLEIPVIAKTHNVETLEQMHQTQGEY